MVTQTQAAKGARFRALHAGPRILVLPNAWDAASARIFERAGFPSIGTTSAGIALSLGYPDGQRAPFEEVLEVIRHLARAVSVPVSADLEAGYGVAVQEVAENVKAMLAAGAVGLNLEDGMAESRSTLAAIALQVEKIKAIRELGSVVGIPLVINARTDVYLRGVGEPASRFDQAVRRANAYREAGADCLFVPGVSDIDTITNLVREIAGPVNILAVAVTPPVSELERVGVRRVSCGSGPMRAAMGLTQRIARELLDAGTYTAFIDGAIPSAEANELFQIIAPA